MPGNAVGSAPAFGAADAAGAAEAEADALAAATGFVAIPQIMNASSPFVQFAAPTASPQAGQS
jgi:hypothetical protein